MTRQTGIIGGSAPGMPSRRPALTPDPDALASAAASLQDVIGTDGPAALAPAALGRLYVAVHGLADTASYPTTSQRLPADLLHQIRVALAEIVAYRQVAATPRRTVV